MRLPPRQCGDDAPGSWVLGVAWPNETQLRAPSLVTVFGFFCGGRGDVCESRAQADALAVEEVDGVGGKEHHEHSNHHPLHEAHGVCHHGAHLRLSSLLVHCCDL